MPVFRSLVFSAVFAGLIVGAVLTVAQALFTVPLILAAETYEQAGEAAGHSHAAPAAHDHAGHDHAGHDHGWQPAGGYERLALTGLSNVVTTTGFALMLLAGYSLRGAPSSWRGGLLWGLAGFAAFSLAPALGLPPELPGAPAADLAARQLWWAFTVAATLAGLGLAAFMRSPLAILAGLALIVVPHLVGAPDVADAVSDVPEALTRQFIVAAMSTNLLSWALLGAVTAMLARRASAKVN